MQTYIFDNSLLDDANHLCQDFTCTIKSGQAVYSTKSVKHGRWYYEITHIEGNFMFTAGFSPDKLGYIALFPYGLKNDATFVYDSDIVSSSEIKKYGRLNASSFFEKQTYGIGIDLETNLFFIQSSKEIRRYQFSMLKENKGIWYARLQESTPGPILNDTISINFGQKPFNLSVPFGFQPFIEKYKDFCKTIHSRHICLNKMLFLVFIILDVNSFDSD